MSIIATIIFSLSFVGCSRDGDSNPVVAIAAQPIEGAVADGYLNYHK